MSCSRLGTSHSKPGMPHCQEGMSRFQLATPHCQEGMPHSQLRTPYCQQEMPRCQLAMSHCQSGMARCQRGTPHCQQGMGHSLPPLLRGRKEKGGSLRRRARSEIGNAHSARERIPVLTGMRRGDARVIFSPAICHTRHGCLSKTRRCRLLSASQHPRL